MSSQTVVQLSLSFIAKYFYISTQASSSYAQIEDMVCSKYKRILKGKFSTLFEHDCNDHFGKLLDIVRSILGNVTTMGNWSIDDLITKSRDYVNLEAMSKAIKEQKRMYDDLKAYQQIVTSNFVLDNRSYGSIKERYAKMKVIQTRFNPSLDTRHGLIIGDKIISHLSGPTTLVIIEPTFDKILQVYTEIAYVVPTIICIGDEHNSFGSCDPSLPNVGTVHSSRENLEVGVDLIRALNDTTHSTIDIYVEMFSSFNYVYELLNLPSQEKFKESLKIDSPSKGIAQTIIKDHRMCFSRLTRNIRDKDLYCPTPNIRWHYGDIRQTIHSEYPFEHIFNIVMTCSMYPSTLTSIKDTIVSAKDLYPSFDAILELVIGMIDLIFTNDTYDTKRNKVTSYYFNKLYKLSYMSKVCKRSILSPQFPFETLYSIFIDYYHQQKNANYTVMHYFMINQCRIRIHMVHQILQEVSLHGSVSLNSKHTIQNMISDRHFFPIQTMTELYCTFFNPFCDCGFLYRVFKTIRASDQESKPIQPWLIVCCFGASHVDVIRRFMSEHMHTPMIVYPKEVRQLPPENVYYHLQTSKITCITFDQPHNLNNRQSSYAECDLI